MTNLKQIGISSLLCLTSCAPNGIKIIDCPNVFQQWRLFPHLAALFAMKATARTVYPILADLFQIMVDPNQTLSEVS